MFSSGKRHEHQGSTLSEDLQHSPDPARGTAALVLLRLLCFTVVYGAVLSFSFGLQALGGGYTANPPPFTAHIGWSLMNSLFVLNSMVTWLHGPVRWADGLLMVLSGALYVLALELGWRIARRFVNWRSDETPDTPPFRPPSM